MSTPENPNNLSAVPPDDLDEWLAGLAGQGPADAETTALAQAITRSQQAEQARLDATQSPDAENQAWQQLRFRFRREGLLTPEANRNAWYTRWQVWAPTAAVATLVAVLVVPSFTQPDGPMQVSVVYREAPNYRSGTQAKQTSVKDPLASAQKLAQILTKNQVTSTVYFHEGKATVDFDLAADQTNTIAKDLQGDYPQTTLQTGLNRIVFTPQP